MQTQQYTFKLYETQRIVVVQVSEVKKAKLHGKGIYLLINEQTNDDIFAFNKIYNNDEEISSKIITENPEFLYYTRT